MAEKINPGLKMLLPISGSRGEEKLGRLKRRAGFLKTRVAEADATGRDLTFDKAEISAIEWVLERVPTLEKLVFDLQDQVSHLEEMHYDRERE